MYFYELGFESYDQYLQSSLWQKTNQRYRNSNRSKYCFICDSPNYLLHHESYENLGEEDLDKDMVALCQNCHELVHFDEGGEKVPLKKEFLKERRLQLRRKYVLEQLKATTLIPFLGKILYRIFW